MRQSAWLWLACAALSACRGGELDALQSRLVLHMLPDCVPARVERLVVEPLGDFALGEQAAIASDLGDQRILLTGLPADSQWFRVHAETPDRGYRAYALGRALRSGEAVDALVLPLTRVCSVHDRALPRLGSSALALAGDDDLLIAGGFDAAGAATRSAQLLHVARAELEGDPTGLDVPRGDATGLALVQETWVLGGAWQDQADGAWDTFERYALDSGSFVGLGRMREGRVRPAALALSDGSALVAGGRAGNGEALRSLETISADASRSELWDEALPFAATDPGPGLLLRDDGRVLALGVASAQTRFASVDPGSRGVRALPGPPLAQGAIVPTELAVALPGARAALVEVDEATRLTTGDVFIQLPDDSFLKIADPRQMDEVTWLASVAGIGRGRALALRDGRLLLTGERQGMPVARLLDPARRDVAVRALDVVPEALFLRSDGSVLMVSSQGVRILREDADSPYDNPGGNLLADDSGVLCLDAYGRFEREGLALRATVRDARLDLVPLRFADVRLSVIVDGPAELLLRRADGAERAIEVGGDEVGPAYCRLSLAPGQELEIERRAERITMRGDKREKSCQLDGLTGSIAVALRAREAGVRAIELRATRL